MLNRSKITFHRRSSRAGVWCVLGRYIMVFAVLSVGLGFAQADEAKPLQVDFFESRIRPVLIEHCYKCHSSTAKTVRGGLLLDSRDAGRKGGDSGPAVVPHDPAASLLLRALRHDDLEMPPDRRLPEHVIADFESWIRSGAVDPRESVSRPAASLTGKSPLDSATANASWAFQSPRPVPLPTVTATEWPSAFIDPFILARLEAEELSPANQADRRTLIRRLSFDLTGLPPTPEELSRVLVDAAPDAIDRYRDRLLASPHFSERWARHWLDIVRFAESTGGGRTRVLDLAWRYRDYVIRSINADKAYSQFVIEQIAGDVLPFEHPEDGAEQLTATGFLALGPTNYELQDKDLLRMEVVDEQMDTIGRAMLGLTIGCARCHDHKFDPIPTRDYYALAGIFRSTKSLVPGNVSGFVQRPVPVVAEWQAAVDVHEKRVSGLEQRLAAIVKELKKIESGSTAALDKLLRQGIVVDDSAAEIVGEWNPSTSVTGFVGSGYLHDMNQFKGKKSARFTATLQQSGDYEIRVAYTASSNRAAQVPVTIRFDGGQSIVFVDQTRPGEHAGVFSTLGVYPLIAGSTGSVTIETTGTAGHVIVDAVQWVHRPPSASNEIAPSASSAVSLTGDADRPDATAMLTERLQREQRELQDDLRTLQQQAPSAIPEVMSVRDEDTIEDCPLHIRGEIRNHGKPVPRGFLTALGVDVDGVIPPDRSGRLELARWLTDERNPLTARVYVNRVWQHLIGHGLVRTPDNFGAMGESPTHPELLDALAICFTRDNWNLRRLIRRITSSSTYRLASQDGRGNTHDPGNRLLGRMNRRRLDAECLRDAILFVSDRLDRRPGGHCIAPNTKTEFGYEFTSVRRSVYVPAFRNTLHPLLAAFDVADPNLVTGKRTTSTLATQALYLMNNPFVLEQADYAADRFLAIPFDSDDERLDFVWQSLIGRSPTTDERLAVVPLLQLPTAAADVTAIGQTQAVTTVDSTTADITIIDAASVDGATSDTVTGAAADDADVARRDAVRRDAWSIVIHGLLASLDFRFLD